MYRYIHEGVSFSRNCGLSVLLGLSLLHLQHVGKRKTRETKPRADNSYLKVKKRRQRTDKKYAGKCLRQQNGSGQTKRLGEAMDHAHETITGSKEVI